MKVPEKAQKNAVLSGDILPPVQTDEAEICPLVFVEETVYILVKEFGLIQLFVPGGFEKVVPDLLSIKLPAMTGKNFIFCQNQLPICKSG